MRTSLRYLCHLFFLLNCVLMLLAPAVLCASDTKPLTYSNEQLLSDLVVVSLTEQTLHSQPALALTFSQPLESTTQFNDFITITKNGARVVGEWVLDANQHRLYFSAIEPGQEYRVQLRPGLSSQINPKKLQHAADMTLKTRPLVPAFDFTSRGSILPTHLSLGLPIRVVNIPELDIEFLRVAPENLSEVLKKIQLGRGFRVYDLNEINHLAKSVYTTRYSTHIAPNANEVRVIPIESIPALQQQGLYFAVMRQPGSFGDNAYRLTYFLVSDLGLHVRRYATRLEVFANNLTTGKALKGVALQLQGENNSLFEAKTDQDGKASFAEQPAGTLLLTAHVDEQFGFLDLRDDPLDLSDYDLQGEPDNAENAFLYSGRNLFHPTEAVDLSILLRDRDGLRLSEDEVLLRIKRPDQKVLLEQWLMSDSSDLGYFYYQFNIPSDAALGKWTAEVLLKSQPTHVLNQFDFTVQAPSTEHLALNVTRADPNLDIKKKMVLALEGRYIEGLPAMGYTAKLTRTAQLQRHPFPRFQDFYFGDPRDIQQWPANDIHEVTLNDKGSAFVELSTDPFKTQSPILINLTTELFEPGGHSVVHYLEQPYWPANALAGIKPLFSDGVAEENASIGFEIAYLDKKGVGVAADALAVSLLQVEYDYYWEYINGAGWQQRQVVHHTPLQQQKIQVVAGTPSKVSFQVKTGDYWLEVEDPVTQLKVAYPFRAGWRWQGDNAGVRPDRVKLTLDKRAYQAGDVARVTITPPSAGEAMLAVEGHELLWSKRVNLPAGGATFEIPLADDWQRHDLYVTALLLRPANSAQKISPNRALGIVHLPLDRRDRELKLTIQAPETVLPEQLVTVTIKADNLANSHALVTLSAEDAGLLSMTEFSPPNPFHYYFAAHRYPVELYDVYGKVIESFGHPVSKQSLGDQYPKHPSSSMQAEAIPSLFSGAVPFNAQGEAHIKLNIPSAAGKLRLTAVAIAEAQMGVATRDMVVSAPVALELHTPSFLATDDAAYLVTKVTNRSDIPQVIKISVGTNEFLTFTTSADHDYRLDKDQSKVLYFPIRAGQRIGQGKIDLRLSGQGFVMNRAMTIKVRSSYPRQTRSRLYTISTEDGAVTLDRSIIQQLQPDSLQARFTLSSTPEMGVRTSLDALLAYPYTSLEHLISKAYPYLFLDEALTTNLGMTPFSLAEREALVQEVLIHLSGMQLANGSFALWGGSSAPNLWLTAYAADFLLDAKEQQFDVPDSMLNQVLAYLETQLSNNAAPVVSDTIDVPEHLAFAVKAYSAYVLARVKRVSLGDLRALYDQDSKAAVSSLPLVHIGLALYKRGDSKRSREAFERALAVGRDDKNDLGDYGSVIRDGAMSLALLIQAQQTIPELDGKIKELYRQIYVPNYLSTQEQCAIFQLGRQLAATQVQPNWGAQLLLQSRALRINQMGAYRLDLAARDFNAGVTVQADNGMSVYASLDIQGYSEQPPVERVDNFQIKRTLYDIKGHLTTPEQLRLGDLVLVYLKVNATDDTRDALVVDLLPAGWVLEPRSLSQNAELANLTLEGIDKPLGVLVEASQLATEHFDSDRYWAALSLTKKAGHHLFYLARVVSAGQFKQPPPYVVDMYHTEHYGIGVTGGSLVIPRLEE